MVLKKKYWNTVPPRTVSLQLHFLPFTASNFDPITLKKLPPFLPHTCLPLNSTHFVLPAVPVGPLFPNRLLGAPAYVPIALYWSTCDILPTLLMFSIVFSFYTRSLSDLSNYLWIFVPGSVQVELVLSSCLWIRCKINYMWT